MKSLILTVLLCAAQLQAQNLSFVACPMVRDTKTTPCWLAEYKGETYFLGIQSGVAADYYPPQLNHEVLVEGVVAQGPRVCGGIPMASVKTSVMVEINRACNTILPVEDGIEAPRPPATRPGTSWFRNDGPTDTTLFFDFDNDFLSLHTTGAVERAVKYFQQSKAGTMQVAAYRGASKLSDGTVMTEKGTVAADRAANVRDILVGLGVPLSALRIQLINTAPTPDGGSDPWTRKITLSVRP